MSKSLVIMAGQSNAIALNGGNGGIGLGAAYAGMTGSSGVVTRMVAANGAPLTFGRSKDDWYNSNEMKAGLIGTIRAALDADPDLVLAGVVWVQGEADSHAVARAGEYGARMVALVESVAAALAGYGARTADFRVSLLALSDNCPEGESRAQWDMVRNQQLAIDHPRITVVDPDLQAAARQTGTTSMFQSDGLHYQASLNATLLPSLLGGLNLKVTGTDANDALRGGAGRDLVDGGWGNDTLSGGTGDDTLWGMRGDDALYGGWGNDVVNGGNGHDLLMGGQGADRFVFTLDPANQGGGIDRITDFQRGVDLIDLRYIDADPNRGGDQSFRLVSGAPAGPGQPGALWMTGSASGTTVYFDANGDGRADGSVLVAGVASLSVTDFVL